MGAGGDAGEPVAVIGGGITGLSAALELARRGHHTVVYEGEDRFGGKLRTSRFGGLDIDEGPDAFLTRLPQALELCQSVGLSDQITSPATGKAYVWTGGTLRPFPAGLMLGVPARPAAVMRSRLLSPAGLARAGLEPLVPRGRPDDCLGAQVRRRFGHEVLERLIDPLVGGIYAGDADQMSLAAAAPQIAELATHRSWLLAARRQLRAIPTGPKQPVFATVRAGLSTMVEALVGLLDNTGVELRRQCPVAALERASDQTWLVNGERFGAVVVTTPASVTARLLRALVPDAAKILAAVQEVSVALVTLGFNDTDIGRPLDASGYLVPKPEQRHVTACSWASAKWAHWRISGQAIVRASVGHAGDQHAVALDDNELVDAVLADLAAPMALRGAPTDVRISRFPGGFPQYRPGHLERVAAVERAVASHAPGITLAGAAYRGVGIPACIRQGREAAAAADDRLHART